MDVGPYLNTIRVAGAFEKHSSSNNVLLCKTSLEIHSMVKILEVKNLPLDIQDFETCFETTRPQSAARLEKEQKLHKSTTVCWTSLLRSKFCYDKDKRSWQREGFQRQQNQFSINATYILYNRVTIIISQNLCKKNPLYICAYFVGQAVC